MRDETIGEFLDGLAARSADRPADRVPAPGGGASAALYAAQAAALLGRVARRSTGERYAAHRATVERIITETDELRAAAVRLAQDDAVACAAVADAYRLPAADEEQQAARVTAVATALVGAGRPPAEVIVVADVAVTLAEELLPIGNRDVIAEVAAAAEAARAAATTARVHVEVNLGGIKDTEVSAALAAEADRVDQIAARAEQITAAVREEISERP